MRNSAPSNARTATVVAALLLGACGGRGDHAARAGHAARANRPAHPTASSRSTPTAAPSPAPISVAAAADPGALAQTDQRPTANTPQCNAAVLGLWRAIVTDDPAAAQTFFFPQAAYRQVKDVGDPDGDYQNRLLADYAADIHQLHLQLGPTTRSATFIAFDVPDGSAEWIQPGMEDNKVGYWRVYGSRIRYSVNGEQGSLPVTSLISWRGEWYVVHLGAIR